MSEDHGNAGTNAGANGDAAEAAAKSKRKPRTAEEILKDIEAEEQEAIRRVKERAAKQKAEVQKKLGAAARKAAAVELVDNFRSGIKEALKKPDLQDAEADVVLKKIVQDGLAKLAADAQAEPAANAAPLTLAA